MDSLTKFHLLLRKHNYKVTVPRQKVFLELQKADAPMSNSEVIDRLPNVDKVSIYRTIALFETTDVVHRTWNGFKSKIELSEHFIPHHHHAQCRICGSHISLKLPTIETELAAAAQSINFQLENHHIELVGTCSRCSGTKSS